MAKIKVGGIVIVVELDGKVRRLVRVQTDAVAQNAEVSDEAELKDACDKAMAKTKERNDIDGILLASWPEGQ